MGTWMTIWILAVMRAISLLRMQPMAPWYWQSIPNPRLRPTSWLYWRHDRHHLFSFSKRWWQMRCWRQLWSRPTSTLNKILRIRISPHTPEYTEQSHISSSSVEEIPRHDYHHGFHRPPWARGLLVKKLALCHIGFVEGVSASLFCDLPMYYHATSFHVVAVSSATPKVTSFLFPGLRKGVWHIFCHACQTSCTLHVRHSASHYLLA